MKKSKKAILATAVFVAALNLNGCVYGPPPDHDSTDKKTDTTAKVEAEEDSKEESNNN